MTLIDRLMLIAGGVVFFWQVVVPLWQEKKVFPLVRKYLKKHAKKG